MKLQCEHVILGMLLGAGRVQRCSREMVGERGGLMLCGPHIRFVDGGRRVAIHWTKDGTASPQQVTAGRSAVAAYLEAQHSKELESGA